MFGSAIGSEVKGEETERWNVRGPVPQRKPVTPMRDFLFVLIYLAMVVTPAVVAVRGARGTGPDE